MVDRNDLSMTDLRLWRRVRAAWLTEEPERRAPDPNELAAYLDGRLSEEAQDRLERFLALSPEALDIVLTAREAEIVGPASTDFVRRAQGLVGPRTSSGWHAWLDRLTAGWADWWPRTAWVGATAAVVLACFAGFELGREGYQNLAAAETLQTEDFFLLPDGSADGWL